MEGYKNQNGVLIPIDEIVIPRGAIMLEIHDGLTGRLKSREFVKNMVVTIGKYSMASALRGNVANNVGQITYCEVGTSTVAPAKTDIALVAPIARKLISTRTDALGIATFTTFFTTSEAVGTLREAGLWGDAAINQIGTGTLYARASINRVKSINDTLTLTWTVAMGL